MDISIGQLVTMTPSVHKELMKSIFMHKIPFIFQSLDTIMVQQEYDLIMKLDIIVLSWKMS